MRRDDWTRASRITLAAEHGAVAHVTIARTFMARCVGLLTRSHLDENEGLLFVPGGSIHTLWMRFAIDVVFLSERLDILKVAERVLPWRCVFAPRGTRFVLELRAGAARFFGIACGGAVSVANSKQPVSTAPISRCDASPQV